jgi:hypothetical protein
VPKAVAIKTDGRNEDPDSVGQRQLPDGWRAGEGKCLPM